MWRTLFTPRWLGLFAVLVAVCAGFAWLGTWQLSVAQHDAVRELQAERDALPELPLDEVITPHASFPNEANGHPVTATGQYDASRQFLVPGRLLEEESGYWVVTPLVAAETGAIVPVLRGFVTDPGAADQPPAEPVLVRGELAPGESPYFGEGPLPQGQRGTIDLSALTNEWSEDLYNGFIFSTAEEPQLTDTVALAHVPPPVLTVGAMDARNLGYALQWWVFAIFAIAVFVKALRDASRPESRPAAHPGEEPGGPASGEPGGPASGGPDPGDPGPARPNAEHAIPERPNAERSTSGHATPDHPNPDSPAPTDPPSDHERIDAHHV